MKTFLTILTALALAIALIHGCAHAATYSLGGTLPQSSYAHTSTNPVITSLTVAPSTTIPVGSLVVVAEMSTTFQTVVPSDSKGNTYQTAISSSPVSSGGKTSNGIYYSVITTALSTGDKVLIGRQTTAGGQMSGLSVSWWANPASSSVLDQTAESWTTTGSSPYTSPSITTTQTNELVFAVCTLRDTASTPTTISIPSGYTLLENPTVSSNSAWSTICYQISSSTGTFAPSFTNSDTQTTAALATASFTSGSSATGSGGSSSAATPPTVLLF